MSSRGKTTNDIGSRGVAGREICRREIVNGIGSNGEIGIEIGSRRGVYRQ